MPTYTRDSVHATSHLRLGTFQEVTLIANTRAWVVIITNPERNLNDPTKEKGHKSAYGTEPCVKKKGGGAASMIA